MLRLDNRVFDPVSNAERLADTDVRLDSGQGVRGTPLDYESDLELDDDASVFRFETEYRIDRRNDVQFLYFNIDRDASAVSSEEIRFGDEVFPPGTTLDAFFNNQLAGLSWKRTLLKTDDARVRGSLGLQVSSIRLGLGIAGQRNSEIAESLVPLPLLGLTGNVNLPYRFSLWWRAEWFAMSFDNSKGAAGNLLGSLEHRTFDDVAFGAGYTYSDYRVSADTGDFSGRLDFTHQGW